MNCNYITSITLVIIFVVLYFIVFLILKYYPKKDENTTSENNISNFDKNSLNLIMKSGGDKMTQNKPIKFRVWRKDYNKMFNVSSVRWNEIGDIIELELSTEKKESYYYVAENFDIAEYNIFMRYTGYKDKNSKEIYESDIVEYYDKLYEVRWMLGGFYIRDIKEGSFLEVATNERYMKVVGNIYENPELLENKKEEL